MQATYQPMTAPLKGLGCGLCLSKIFMNQFGGDIHVISKGPGHGCKTSVILPKSADIPELPY